MQILVSGGAGGGGVGGRELENTKISSGPKRAQNRHFHIRNERVFGFGSPRPVLGLPRPGAGWVLRAWSPEPLFFKHGYVLGAWYLEPLFFKHGYVLGAWYLEPLCFKHG